MPTQVPYTNYYPLPTSPAPIQGASSTRYSSFCPVAAQGTIANLLVGIAGEPYVYCLDTRLPANQQFFLMQTHNFSSQEQNTQPLGMVIKGEGQVTAGACVLIADGIRYQRTDVLQFPSDPTSNELVTFNFSGDLHAREWSVIIALAGFGLNLRSHMPIWDLVGT